MRYLFFLFLPVLLPAQSVYESLANYHLAAGDFAAAQRSAHLEPDAEKSAELKERIEAQRLLALRVALAGAARALEQSDWAALRREVSRALAADPGNQEALKLVKWMAERGIVRRRIVDKN